MAQPVYQSASAAAVPAPVEDASRRHRVATLIRRYPNARATLPHERLPLHRVGMPIQEQARRLLAPLVGSGVAGYGGGMMRYIALLRGINVGGHQVTMAALRRLFADLGLANVGSYIQSGNVFFDSDEADRAALRARIEGQLRARLGYEVATCLRTVEEFAAVMALEPFAGIELRPDMRFSVSFLAESVAVETMLPYKTPKGDFELWG